MWFILIWIKQPIFLSEVLQVVYAALYCKAYNLLFTPSANYLLYYSVSNILHIDDDSDFIIEVKPLPALSYTILFHIREEAAVENMGAIQEQDSCKLDRRNTHTVCTGEINFLLNSDTQVKAQMDTGKNIINCDLELKGYPNNIFCLCYTPNI